MTTPGYYKNNIRMLNLIHPIEPETSYGLIYYMENKAPTDILLFHFTKPHWTNVTNIYGYKITSQEDILKREQMFKISQHFNNTTGVVTLPPILTNHNNTLILHYNLTDNYNHRCYVNGFNLCEPSISTMMCNICYNKVNNNITGCSRKNCNFFICNACKCLMINKYNKTDCPNCFISLI